LHPPLSLADRRFRSSGTALLSFCLLIVKAISIRPFVSGLALRFSGRGRSLRLQD
jgi:hypothetical protein